MSECIDLKEQFGGYYRVTYEPNYVAELGERSRRQNSWLLTIPCQHGHIYPHGGELLGASSNHRGRIANRLAALPFVRVVQDGDDGVNVVFHVADFDAVAAILKPRRRRRLSPQQVAERTQRLRKYQFSPASQNAGAARKRDPTRTPAPK